MLDVAFVINDLHYPFQDDRAIKLALAMAARVNPNTIFVNGDLVDMYQASKFTKFPKYNGDTQLFDEIEMGKGFLKELRNTFPKAKIVYIFGNHEYRWELNLATKAPETYRLKYFTLAEQLECKSLGIEVVNSGLKESYYRHGNFLVGHFDRVNQHSGYTAKSLLDKYGMSGMQAHVHRGGSHYRRIMGKQIKFYENFCLCDLNPQYDLSPNWQQGFSIIYQDMGTDYIQVEQCQILQEKNADGILIYKTTCQGQHYKDR